MIIGTSKEPHYPDSGISLYAGTRRFPYQNRSRMASGDLAGAAHHRSHDHYYHHRFPYLETQA